MHAIDVFRLDVCNLHISRMCLSHQMSVNSLRISGPSQSNNKMHSASLRASHYDNGSPDLIFKKLRKSTVTERYAKVIRFIKIPLINMGPHLKNDRNFPAHVYNNNNIKKHDESFTNILQHQQRWQQQYPQIHTTSI